MVKKNCTIPLWLNEKAEALGINFSKVLQDALVQKLDA
jgi:antitoxin HicB